jgi:hypothetical protein
MLILTALPYGWGEHRNTLLTKRTIAMGDVVINPSNADQDLFLFDASDEALEAAASMKENTGAMTLAFCSGLDACPPR